jgi:hypothetical protein
VATAGITIVCNAASHERRPQVITRFRAIGPDLWEEVRVAQEAEHYLIGETPLVAPSLKEVISPDLRARYQFRCGLCDLTVPAKQDQLFAKFNRIRDLLPEYGYKSISLRLLADIV